ncbi:MAG: small-conductance mechanosensitive channel [Spirochaetes bacterium GWD1_27_9]|nr:MAG: small-conductance mechanosensitive channel [Spirochaetes bacterium GWB1_27_13]OHD28120.1 MAG: small-conductance mechanosensitive channel [Spirochaetes bacterium GWC1_27_15]OHD35502.1 MAG: small-conductance mechanosensitive channel [Spirochaetes bacterium GWD1_27_9]
MIFLLIALLLTLFLPLIGSLCRWNAFPPGFGDFPYQKVIEVPNFNIFYFIFACLIAVFITIFLLFPRLFGFKKYSKEQITKKEKVKFPIWFWIGGIILSISWFFMWGAGGIKLLKILSPYAFVPLWWGFIFLLDGIVYKRNSGVSIISAHFTIMKFMILISFFSWFLFEYFNYLVVGNWFYPNNEVFTNFGNIVWFSLSYATIIPAIFEWFTLLHTFDSFRLRYSCGPTIHFTFKAKIIFLILGILLSFGMGFFPFALFWGLWTCLIPILAAVMSIVGSWTAFVPLKKGDWTPIILIALASLFNGFFWELWNYGSEFFNPGGNPNFWKYSVPYLDKIHIFSEMPILGYFGYLFFGIGCWDFWLVSAYLLGFSPDIDFLNNITKIEKYKPK